jgi:exopolysaccharide production protein ExoQ
MLGVAAAFAALAAVAAGDGFGLARRLRGGLSAPAGIAASAMLLAMAASLPSTHAPHASAHEYAGLVAVAAATVVLLAALPGLAPRRRSLIIFAGMTVAAGLIASDLLGGLWLRRLVGGREAPFVHNRNLVTLTLLLWPALAALLAARRLWLVPPLLLILAFAVWIGESGAASLALASGLVILPVAALLPRTALFGGLAALLAILAVQPWFGTLMQRLLSAGFHQRFANAHSGDRVDIWLSFEAAARAKWFMGSGFGSSLDMQKAPVAALVPPDRVTLLGAGHPHNAFLQIWVELGVVGASLAAVLIVLLFTAVSRMRPALQPFAITCIGVTALVALVSHGAWQAWWWAAIGASMVGFALLEHDLRRGEPPR